MFVTRRLLAVLALAAALAAVLVAPAAAQNASAPECTSATVLKPGNEVRLPGTTDPVESRAFGAAFVHIKGTKLFFSVVIVNPARETFILGHIHPGAAGVNNPPIVTLFEGFSSSRLFVQADVLEIGADTAAAICGDLAGHYVNYHTTQDPEGAVRGQLR
jgi:CHRD domain